jgi:hypothetical protein
MACDLIAFHGHTSPAIQPGAWLDGHPIRRARKRYTCDYWHGRPADPALPSGRCKNVIQPGDLFVEGERNDEAGGFGYDRYCAACGGIVPVGAA